MPSVQGLGRQGFAGCAVTDTAVYLTQSRCAILYRVVKQVLHVLLCHTLEREKNLSQPRAGKVCSAVVLQTYCIAVQEPFCSAA